MFFPVFHYSYNSCKIISGWQVRKLELLITILVFVMAACFFGEMGYVKPPAVAVLKGMFIPKLSGQGATGDAIALLGALVMPYVIYCLIKYPSLFHNYLFFSFLIVHLCYTILCIPFLLTNRHNLFLHSALVLSRKIPNSVHGINVRIYCLQIAPSNFIQNSI